MCLCTYKRRPMKAEEDITCYKIVWNHNVPGFADRCLSLYQKFAYTLGQLYRKRWSWWFRATPDYIYSSDDTKVYSVWNGFHSYTKQPDAISYNGMTIVRCTIPKGSKYFVSRDGDEYCSNQIIVNEFIIQETNKNI